MIADILSVSIFVLLDWRPVDVWDRAKSLARNREVRELYATIRYSNDGIAHSGMYDAADTGQGYTSEELFNAVSVVMGVSAQTKDRMKAGEVLSHFDGAEIFNQMCREHNEFSERFNSLVKEYRDTKP